MGHDDLRISQTKQGVATQALDEDGRARGDLVGDGLTILAADPTVGRIEEIGLKFAKVAIFEPYFIRRNGTVAFLKVVSKAEVLEKGGGGKGGGDEVESALDDRAGMTGLHLARLDDLYDVGGPCTGR